MLAVTVPAKIRIRPDADAEAALSATMAAYRDDCNTVSEYIFRTGDWKQASIHEALYYKLREQFRLRSQMAQSVIKTVIARYRTILSNGDEWTLIRFKKPQYDGTGTTHCGSMVCSPSIPLADVLKLASS